MSTRRKVDQVAAAWLGFFGTIVAFFAVIAIGEVIASTVFHLEEGAEIGFGARLVVAPLTFLAISAPAIWGARTAARARRQQIRGATLPLVACWLEIAYVLFSSVVGLAGWS